MDSSSFNKNLQFHSSMVKSSLKGLKKMVIIKTKTKSKETKVKFQLTFKKYLLNLFGRLFNQEL